jgi:hypothetical protein
VDKSISMRDSRKERKLFRPREPWLQESPQALSRSCNPVRLTQCFRSWSLKVTQTLLQSMKRFDNYILYLLLLLWSLSLQLSSDGVQIEDLHGIRACQTSDVTLKKWHGRQYFQTLLRFPWGISFTQLSCTTAKPC